jgi:hypothetical protein
MGSAIDIANKSGVVFTETPFKPSADDQNRTMRGERFARRLLWTLNYAETALRM